MVNTDMNCRRGHAIADAEISYEICVFMNENVLERPKSYVNIPNPYERKTSFK